MRNIAVKLTTTVFSAGVLLFTAFTIKSSDRLEGLESKITGLIEAMTLEEKISMIHANSKFTIAGVERLGINEMTMSDGPHGVRYEIERHSWNSAGRTDDYATYLPHLTSVAASWDTKMAQLHGQVLGAEARDRGKDFILGPGVNLARLPLYGRNFEYMGEDPILAAKLAIHTINAIQDNDVAATIKHYALNTQELNRIGVNAQPDERTLREVYLPAFEYAVREANVLGVMGAYNEYYGTNANQSKHLNLDILKGDWGYQGVLLTDWNVDITSFDAAMNGLDIEMGTAVDSYDEYHMAKPLLKLVKTGKVPESVINDKVRRILRVQHKIGMYDANRKTGSRNTKAHQNAARTIAEQGVILLKNEDRVLPLDSDVKSILVLGPNADKVHGLGGGSSEVKTPYEITPLQGLRNKFGERAEITRMRARANKLSPIAADYIVSRHWTGTPAWHISFYDDSTQQRKTGESWIANGVFDAKGLLSHIVMNADVKALDTGAHTFKMQATGRYSVSIDGKLLLKNTNASGGVESETVMLTAGQSYKIRIDYTGDQQFTLGWDTPKSLFNTEQEYLTAAKNADAVIYFGGLSHADDREAIDRADMKLPNDQDEVIKKLLVANPNTVIFLVAGSAVEMPWIEDAKAVVWGWYGGMEAGTAFANILTGEVNPSGKLPITLPKQLHHVAPIALDDYNEADSLYKEGVFIGYRWFEQQSIEPIFPFGHGLSYTRFAYSDIKLSHARFKHDDGIEVSVKITNTGEVEGSEIVQLYLHDQEATVVRPFKELKGFAKVHLQPDESKIVSIPITLRDLSFWDTSSNNWLAEKGAFDVLVGSSSQDIRLVDSFVYEGTQ